MAPEALRGQSRGAGYPHAPEGARVLRTLRIPGVLFPLSREPSASSAAAWGSENGDHGHCRAAHRASSARSGKRFCGF